MVAQRLGGIEHGLQIVRDALRADVADDEASIEVIFFRQFLRARTWRELHRIDAIGHDADLVRRHAALDQPLAQTVIGGHDPGGGAIEHVLDRAQQARRRMAFAHHVERHDRVGPQVAYLQKPGTAFRHREQPPGQARQELRGGGHDHVGLLEQAGQEAGDAETGEIERTADHGGVGRQIGPDPDDVDSVLLSRAGTAGSGRGPSRSRWENWVRR